MKPEKVISIRFNPSGSQKKPLFVIVPKTISKKASERNLLRRRIKQIMMNKKQKKDIKVFVKNGAEQLSFKELKSALENEL